MHLRVKNQLETNIDAFNICGKAYIQLCVIVVFWLPLLNSGLPEFPIPHWLQGVSLWAQRGLHTSTGSTRGGKKFILLQPFFFNWETPRGGAHVACPLLLSLLLINCSADWNINSTNKLIEETKEIWHASACVDSCIKSGKTTALAMATDSSTSRPRAPSFYSFLF